MPDLFKTLRLQHFMSHVDTKLSLANRGLVLIAGSNGSGKSSTLPDGLLFAGYGRTLRGASGPKLVNRSVGENGLATLEGEDPSGVPYILERPIKHRKKPKSTITVGGEKYTGDAEVDRVFRRIVGGCGYEALVAAMIYGKGDAQFFTQLTDAKRKQILDELLSFGDLNRFLDAAKTAVKRLDEAAADCLRQIEVTRALIVGCKEQITTLTDRAEHFETRRGQELQACEALLKADRTAVMEKRKAVAKLEKALPKTTELLKEATAEYDGAVEVVDEIKAAGAAQNKSVAVLRTKLEAVHEKLEDFSRRIKATTTRAGTKCATCGQLVSEEFADACITQLREEALPIRAEESRLVESLSKAHAICEQLIKGLAPAVTEVEEKRRTVQEVRQLVEKAKDSLRTKQQELRDVEQRIARTEAEEDRIKAQTNDFDTERKTAEKKLSQLNAKEEAACTQAAALADQQLYYDFWIKGFGNAGIKSLLLDGVIPRLNASAERYSQLLTDGMLRVSFSPNRELKDGRLKEEFIVAVDIDDAAPDYTLASDGQRRRADIISTLALGDIAASRIGAPLNLLVMDEVFDGLDPSGMERAVQLLQHMTADRSSIFVMTHSESMAGYFPQVIQVQRHNGVSILT